MYFLNGVKVVQEIVHRDAISVEMELDLDGLIYRTVGVARRHPTDRFDQEVGIKLAYSRALAQLAAKLDKQAVGQMKHNEDMHEAKLVQKEKRRVNEFWDQVLKDHKPLQKQRITRPNAYVRY